MAFYGLRKFWFHVVDENGERIRSGLKISVLSANGAIATIYSDDIATALTNPITSSAFAGMTDDIVVFYSAETAFDIEIVNEVGGHMKLQGFNATTHRLVFDSHRADSQLVYAAPGFSAELVDTAGVFTDFSLTKTLAGEELKVGDVVEIFGQVLFEDFNAADTLDLKVMFGTEAILQTGDQTPAADEDTITFHLFATVLTASGASAKLRVTGNWWTDLNGTVVCYVVSPTYAQAAGLAEDISGDVIIKCSGDWSALHADNECVLSDLRVIVHHNGNV